MKLFNTLSGSLEEFIPQKSGEVKMYTCGPTVYDYAHIGNFRAFVFEDLLRRYFEYLGMRVFHVMNLTDVDDKTIAGSIREKRSLSDFTEPFIRFFQEDLKTLNILHPNHPEMQPRATHEIPSMIELIQKLIKQEVAYVKEGSVYFRISKFPSYGKLSKKDLHQNREGARVDVDEYEKETGADFVLWKAARPGEPFWSSPWGEGRPGWHIECSAMSMKYLGESFDLHAGGEDLVFPHHENEIAQSEAATGKPFVRYWLHCKFLLVNGEKMSKSKGNFYTLRDLISKGFDPLAIRYVLISSHYRSPLNFTLEGVRAAERSLQDLRAFYSSVLNHEVFGRGFAPTDDFSSRIQTAQAKIESALDQDLNISEALAALYEFVGQADSLIKKEKLSKAGWDQLKRFLARINQILCVIPNQDMESFSKEALDLFYQRKQMRIEKKFKESDDLRGELQKIGYQVWDEAGGRSGLAK